MESEVQAGIELFKKECEKILPGISIVIPVRPTAGAFLVSFSFDGFRTYGTIHEDDFADWGEGTDLLALRRQAEQFITKWREGKKSPH